ncbi:MAG: hypothetical protein ACREIW_00865 [Chthoniobacterales bacterium]
MTRYEHTQIGYLTIAVVSVAAIAVVIIAIPAPPPNQEILLGVFVVLVLTAIVFRKLTITIENEMLRACFGGLICKKVTLAKIVAFQPIRIRWWYGWGIHLVPTPYGWGWLYNISGWDAVAIKLRDGRRLALGTDDSGGLVTAIEAATGRIQVRATT